jgi:hypothetical protein
MRTAMDMPSLLPKLLSMILSWLDAGNLRTRFYHLNDKLEIARVAIEDIERMDDLDLIKALARRTLEKL